MTTVFQAIEIVVTRVLGEWALMTVEPVEREAPFDHDEEFFIGTVTFSGIVRGKCQLICQAPFLNILVANVLCTDIAPNESEQLDAFRELANVLVGNLITETYGVDTVFDLSSPQIKKVSYDEAAPYFAQRTFSYYGDDEPIAITFSLDMGQDDD